MKILHLSRLLNYLIKRNFYSGHPTCILPLSVLCTTFHEPSIAALNHHLDELLFVFPFVIMISCDKLALLGMAGKNPSMKYTSGIGFGAFVCFVFGAELVITTPITPGGGCALCDSELGYAILYCVGAA